MKTYKEYYQFGLGKHFDWKSKQKEEWWKRGDQSSLEPKGDYIETVKFLSVDEKNDASLFINTTNIKNSEWDILFSMLGQALVDWCVENVKYENLWSFDLKIERYVENGENIYLPTFKVTNYKKTESSFPQTAEETNVKKLNNFKKCSEFLFDMVTRFIESNGKNIPNDWNHFSFGLDGLSHSCEYGEWVCTSDGYMNLMNVTDGEYDQFVECM